MKNYNYIINGVLIVAIIVLFILQFTGRKADSNRPVSLEALIDSTGFHLPVAYIRTDSLLVNYKFYNDLTEENIKKIEDKKMDINRRSDNFQKQVLAYQEKAQANGFISPERRQQEENRLTTMQQDLQKYVAQVEQELSIENDKMQRQLHDTIVNAIKLFNTPKKYELIFSNTGTDNLFYADDSYDITQEIIDFLNARYIPGK